MLLLLKRDIHQGLYDPRLPSYQRLVTAKYYYACDKPKRPGSDHADGPSIETPWLVGLHPSQEQQLPCSG